MECPTCGYVMDAFARTCPRCARLGKRAETRVHAAEAVADENYRRSLLRQAFQPRSAPPPPAIHYGLASTALTLGLLGPLTALPGLVLGSIALHQINRSNGRFTGAGQAIAGIVFSGFSLMLLLGLVIWCLPLLRDVQRHAGEASQMVKQLIHTVNRAQQQLQPLTDGLPSGLTTDTEPDSSMRPVDPLTGPQE